MLFDDAIKQIGISQQEEVENQIKLKLKGFSIEALIWITLKVEEYPPVINFNNGVLTFKRDYNYKFEKRDEPLSIEEATTLYILINS